MRPLPLRRPLLLHAPFPPFIVVVMRQFFTLARDVCVEQRRSGSQCVLEQATLATLAALTAALALGNTANCAHFDHAINVNEFFL